MIGICRLFLRRNVLEFRPPCLRSPHPARLHPPSYLVVEQYKIAKGRDAVELLKGESNLAST
ncbi:hypothetical protein K432DRAFT_176382 [Lepidopterella palustris CBS 459.81]|uniref:Uncharacterized protein n=1 Tax=Lepidopterella palustris CBS 459.81 TaxID=1314670 RepID=A0A8E2EGT5_9PEZI|nr:hypothetical protein K432DRAFT_176382 [Lepidopterella palustris CBS 459.81]